jgi:RNA polymerase sigma-70 factor (ECF subfamily)
MNLASLPAEVERAREGDSEAWGRVYQTLAPSVFRLCRRILPTREDAEDATAEIFLKAQMHLDQYDSERPLQAWLYRMAANHCWDELRKRRGRKEKESIELTDETIESHEPDPYQKLLASETNQEIRAGLAQLNDRDRMAVSLRYFAELSYEEIAEVLGITSTFVGVLLLRARRKLRRVLASPEKQ